MKLNEEIQHLLAGYAIPEPAVNTIAAAMEQIDKNKIAPGLDVGARAPEIRLPDIHSKQVSLNAQLAAGPVVLTFFRGDWCPICNLQLRALQRALPDIRAAGASLLAVTPQSVAHTLSLAEKAEIEFTVLSDTDQRVIREYRLQFLMPPKAQEVYLGVYGLDLGKQNADGGWNLPVPGTFIIDQHGIIRTRHVTADFTRRMEPDDVIDALAGLTGPSIPSTAAPRLG